MIVVTGDTHGHKERLLKENISTEYELGEGDYIIVCGDFGYIFTNSSKESKFLDSLENEKFNILFIDGNHENFPAIFSYPEQMWNGGHIHRIRKNIIHLMRGQVYNIEDKKIFTMGGAYSIDKAYRREGESWWPEEMPSESEYEEAKRNLKKVNYNVDYIITHAAPDDTMCIFHPEHNEEIELNFFLEWVRENVSYKHWYMGHLHLDKSLWRQQTVLYYDVIDVETNQRI